MKILREARRSARDEKENDRARRIREVEELMDKNEVVIFSFNEMFVKIAGKDFRLKSGSSFPRWCEDELLEVI
jgi:hypothetical protein